jgi:hypothetical protein
MRLWFLGMSMSLRTVGNGEAADSSRMEWVVAQEPQAASAEKAGLASETEEAAESGWVAAQQFESSEPDLLFAVR